MQPLDWIDWERVEHASVKVESGSVRFRFGSTEAKKNLNLVASDPRTGDPFVPGKPIMWPSDFTAQAGDPERETFIMPISTAKDVFGFWEAPREAERGSLSGLTLNQERARVAAFWGGFKRAKGDGTMNPPTYNVGPPNVPRVAITLLDRQMRPVRDIEGNPVVVRPRDFYEFDVPGQYEADTSAPAPSDPAVQFVAGLSQDELDDLREFLKTRRKKASNAAA